MSDAFSQIEIVDSIHQKVSLEGDELNPFWSADGNQLLFQSNQKGNWDIYLYDLSLDSVIQLTFSPANEENPVWKEMGKSFVFDSDRTGEERLYTKNLETGKTQLLFEREIRARQASFSKSGKLVFFSGFDPIQKQWDIYSFEFYYQNLNHLIELPGENHSPQFSWDGDHVLFINSSNDYPFHFLKLMNWYGELSTEFSDFEILDPSWGPRGLKVYFVSGMEGRNPNIYSMWADGSHLEKLTNDPREIKDPTVSPDGSKLAASLKTHKSFDIYILSLEDY